MALPKTPAGSLGARARLRVIHTLPHAPAASIWLDLANAEVKKGSRTLQLKPKAFAVLRHLCERAPQLVSKQELFAAVWAETYVTDGVLKNCIAEIRQALQDSVAKPQYIETVARRGYRFIGAIQDPAVAVQPPKTPSVALSPHSRAGERRQLTVLSCDVGSAPTRTTALDPEDYRALLQTLTSTCRKVVAQYDGHVVPSGGGGILVYFGYPMAHEDTARRAVQAGMDIIQALQRLPSPELKVRIGIHTGPVVIDEKSTGEHAERVAVGETLRLATYLQALADVDTLMISAATQRLVAGYAVCKQMAPPGGNGLSDAFPVYRVVGTNQMLSRLDVATATGLTPLVGREGELTLLRQQAEHVRAGQGHVVLLSGEAGIGKSRLAQTLKASMHNSEEVSLEFRCSPYYQTTAFYPIIAHLQRVLAFQSEDTVQVKVGKLHQLLAHYRFPQADTLPLLAGLLSLPHPEGVPPLALTPQRQKQQLLDTLIAWLMEEAERALAYLLWEDVQWADPSTLEVITRYLDQVPLMRTLVVFTARPDFQPPWGLRSYISHLTLGTLPRTSSEAMVRQIPGGQHLPPEVVQQIVSKADGVPLYVEELTKAVVESGNLGIQELAAPTGKLPPPTLPVGVPATLHDTLMTRLDRLGPAKDIAQIGAVVGREFSYDLLQAIGLFDATVLQTTLPQLVGAELVYQRGVGERATYTFKHALIQDTAYQSLLKSTRQHYHQQIAQVLESRFPEVKETQPELLAHHYTEAELAAQAIEYWQQAGQRATQRSANLEAVAHFTRALALLTLQPETPERVPQELMLQLALGTPLLLTKGHGSPEVESTYTRARELCRQMGDTPPLFPVLFGLWRFYLGRAQIAKARELAEHMLERAQSADDVVLRLYSHAILTQTLMMMGAYAQTVEQADHGLALYDPQQHRSYVYLYGNDARIICLTQSALALWHLGYPDLAHQRNQDALAWSEELAHPYTQGYTLGIIATCDALRREAREGQERAEAKIALAREQDFPLWEGFGMVLRGWALTLQNQSEEGIANIGEGTRIWRASGGAVLRPMFLYIYALACEGEARPADGLRAVDEALRLVEATGERHSEVELYRTKGELLLQSQASLRQVRTSRDKSEDSDPRPLTPDPQGEAEACFVKAIDLARQRHAKSLELRATIGLAQLWRSQGKQAEAHRELSDIYDWFTEGLATQDLQEAKTLIDSL